MILEWVLIGTLINGGGILAVHFLSSSGYNFDEVIEAASEDFGMLMTMSFLITLIVCAWPLTLPIWIVAIVLTAAKRVKEWWKTND